MNQHDRETHKYWIETLESEALDRLNEWETDFLANMKLRLDNGWALTDNQEAKLESIYTTYTS